MLATKQVSAQQDYYIKDVYLDGVKMGSSNEDYRTFFKGETIMDTLLWNDYEEETIRTAIYEGDSLYIHMASYERSRLYSKYIEIFSSQYEIKLHNMIFRVGMNMEDLAILLPNIKERYEKYIGKNKKYFSIPAYFGKQLIIETQDPEVPFYPCQGLKFQISEGKVISIMIDFRTDGDF
jgi:hypothetical protein